jgi:hypothetical protein
MLNKNNLHAFKCKRFRNTRHCNFLFKLPALPVEVTLNCNYACKARCVLLLYYSSNAVHVLWKNLYKLSNLQSSFWNTLCNCSPSARSFLYRTSMVWPVIDNLTSCKVRTVIRFLHDRNESSPEINREVWESSLRPKHIRRLEEMYDNVAEWSKMG